MLIDCDRCEMRDIACRDCMVTALLSPAAPAGALAGTAEIGPAEWRALRVLADARMVSPLRLREPMARAS
jgi:hypothetical protein